jgi:pSer/pThr/pTyr-binding forkhead associated (FHA) protein
MQSHWLRITDDKGKQDFILEEEFYSLGRDTQCGIRLHSRFASRHHAFLKRFSNTEEDYYYEIEDGDGKGNFSANGLLINDQKRKTHILQDGDKIVFGPKVFAIYYHRDIENDLYSFSSIHFIEYENTVTEQFDGDPE